MPIKGEKNQTLDFPSGPVDKNLRASAGDTGLTPGLGWPHMPQSKPVSHDYGARVSGARSL